jgi:nascent polypeptide-associated complex subunit alpha
MVKVKRRVKRRSMERQMRKAGVDYQQMDGATEVIIRFPEKELVISEPQVIMMQAQGEQIYQIIGQPEERAPTSSTQAESGVPTESTPTFTEEDVQLVASQASVTEDQAREALQQAEGNLAKAIIALTGG